MTAAKAAQAAETNTADAPDKALDAGIGITLSLDQLADLVSAKVAEAVAALPVAQAPTPAAAPAVGFQAIAFDKGADQPRVVMTLGDPDSDGRVETRTVQLRHAHILEALGWQQQGDVFHPAAH